MTADIKSDAAVEIVKVQMALYPANRRRGLVYDAKRSLIVEQELSPAVQYELGDDVKGFFFAYRRADAWRLGPRYDIDGTAQPQW
jgi:hypothetical protein